MIQDTVSVVIPAHNEEKYLNNTLESLLKQTLKPFEIIVIADSCTDDTVHVAEKYTDYITTIDAKNVSVAKNVGALYAHGSYVAFLDADVVTNPNLFEQSVDSIKHGAVAAYAPIKTEGPSKKWNAIFNLINNVVLLGLVEKIPRGYLMMRRGAFEHLYLTAGAFNESLSLGEDLEFGDIVKKHGKVKVLDVFNKTTSRREENNAYTHTLNQWFKAYLNHTFKTNFSIDYNKNY